MLEIEKRIMENCGKLVKQLPEREKEKFLTFTEGMAFLSSRMTCDNAPEQQPRK